MWKLSLIIIILFFTTSLPAATDYIDDDGNYYAQTSDQVPYWGIRIDRLGIVNSEGGEVSVITSTTDVVNVADQSISAGSTAGYFSQNVSITPGTYTRIHFRQGANSIFRGCIYDPVQDKYRATPDGTLYDSKAEALAAASDLTIAHSAIEDEYLSMSPHVTVEEGKTYTLTILWDNYGLGAGIPEEGEPVGDFGVGLLWDPGNGEFKDGMLKETYLLREQ